MASEHHPISAGPGSGDKATNRLSPETKTAAQIRVKVFFRDGRRKNLSAENVGFLATAIPTRSLV